MDTWNVQAHLRFIYSKFISLEVVVPSTFEYLN